MDTDHIPGLRELLKRCEDVAQRADRLDAEFVRQAHHLAALHRWSEALCRPVQPPVSAAFRPVAETMPPAICQVPQGSQWHSVC
jgi:hypothetical protein